LEAPGHDTEASYERKRPHDPSSSATIPDVRRGQNSMSVRLNQNSLPRFPTRKKPPFRWVSAEAKGGLSAV